MGQDMEAWEKGIKGWLRHRAQRKARLQGLS